MKVLKHIINILMIISLIVMSYLIIDINLLPKKYIIAIISVVSIISIIYTLLSFIIKKKKSIILSVITESLLIVLSIFVISKLIVTNNFFNRIKNIEETEIYYVLVNTNSNYNIIDDLKDKKIGVISLEIENYINARKEITNYINVEEIKYKNINTLIEDLYNNKIDSILINSSFISMFKELDKDFESKTKVLKELSFKVVEQPVNNTETKTDNNNESNQTNNENNNNLPVKSNGINILISGIDTYGDISVASYSDVNIVLTVNKDTNEILLTSIPRDTHLYIHGIYDMMDKINNMSFYGPYISMQTVEDFLDIDIDYYVKVNFTGFVNIINTIGGLDIYVDRNFSNFQVGWHHFTGEEALRYARIRKEFVDGDFVRNDHQKQVVEAFIKKFATSKTLLLNYDNLLNSLSYLIQTNIPEDLIKEYVKNQLDTNPDWIINEISASGFVRMDKVYSSPEKEVYVTEPYEHIRAYCSRIINGIKRGYKFDTIK